MSPRSPDLIETEIETNESDMSDEELTTPSQHSVKSAISDPLKEHFERIEAVYNSVRSIL